MLPGPKRPAPQPMSLGDEGHSGLFAREHAITVRTGATRILAMASLMTPLVGLSSIALGVHWPPDGLMG